MDRTRYCAFLTALLLACSSCSDKAGGNTSESGTDRSADAADAADAPDTNDTRAPDMGSDSDESIADSGRDLGSETDDDSNEVDADAQQDVAEDDEPVNQAPEGVIDSPAGDIEIVRGETLTFEGFCADPEGETPLTHAWDFGDVAEPSTGAHGGTVLFPNTGEFTISYTCTDHDGLADPTPATVVVTVTDRHVSGAIVTHTNFNPSGVHLDSATGLLYVLSSTTSEILEVDLDAGADRRFRLDGTFDSEGAAGLTVDSEAERIYVLVNKSAIWPHRGHFILAFDLDGELVGITPIAADATITGDGGPVRMALRGVFGLAWDGTTETFYTIAESDLGWSLIAISTDGTFSEVFPTDDFESPTSVAILPSGGFALMNHQGDVFETDVEGNQTGEYAIEGGTEGVMFGLSIGLGNDGTPNTADDLMSTVEVDSSAISGPDYKSQIVVRGSLAGVDTTFGGDDDGAFVYDLGDDLALSFEGREQTHPIAIDSDNGVIYLYDGTNGRIQAISPDGSLADGGFNTIPTPEGTELLNVRGLAYDPVSSGLWILDDATLYRFSTDGSSIQVTYDVRERFDRFSIYGQAAGISFDSASGTLYVLERAATDGSYMGRLTAGDDETWGTEDDYGGWGSDNTLSGATGLAWDSRRDALAVLTDRGSQIHWFDDQFRRVGWVSLAEQAGIVRGSRMAIDPADGSYFVADEGTGALYHLEVRGSMPTVDMAASVAFSTGLEVRGLAIHGDRMIVADGDGEAVWVFDLDWNFLEQIDLMTLANSDSVDGVAIDNASGNLLFIDREGLVTANADGEFLSFVPLVAPADTKAVGPRAIAVDQDSGDIFTIDTEEGEGTERVMQLDPVDGRLTAVFTVKPLPSTTWTCSDGDHLGLVRTPDDTFLLRCVDETGGGRKDAIVEADETGTVLNTLELPSNENSYSVFTVDAATGLLYLLEQDRATVGDVAQMNGVQTLTVYSPGSDGDFGSDDDPDPVETDFTGAFPQTVGTASGTEFLEDMAFVPEDDEILGYLDNFAGNILVRFGLDGSWISYVETCPDDGEICIRIRRHDGGLYWDATDERVFVRRQWALYSIGRDGETPSDVWSDRFESLGVDCCFEGLARHPTTGDFFAVRTTTEGGGSIGRFTAGQDENWGSDDDAFFEVTYSHFMTAQDITWDTVGGRLLVVTEGDSAVRSFGTDWMPGRRYWVGYWSELTALYSIEIHPSSGTTYLYDTGGERLYTAELPE